MESILAEVKKLRRSGDTAGAFEMIESAKRKSPDELVLYDTAAEIHLGADDLESSVREYERFLARNPGDPNALNNFACMLLDHKRPKQAVESLLKAYELAEGNVTIRCNLAAAFKDLGLVEEARKICEKLIKSNANASRPRYILELEIAEVGWRASAASFRTGKVVQLLRRNQPIWLDTPAAYASRIEGIEKNFITVSVPKVDGVTVSFCADTRLVFGYKKKKSFWGCVVWVMKGSDGDGRVLLSRPRRMRKVQKRQHSRILWPGLLREAVLESVPKGCAKPDIDDDNVTEQDVSATGIAILTNREVPVGSVFGLVLGSDDEELSCRGTAVRCRQISPGGYEIGIQFSDLSPEDQDRVADFVFHRRLEKRA